MQDLNAVLSALANRRRLQVLEWLKNPTKHFRPQRFGDLEKDGVCSIFIAEKMGVSQPTASRHLNLLVAVGLLRPKRIEQWTFYSRNEKAISAAKALFRKTL